MAQAETTAGVPYVALGDSLTQGMQSLGVGWWSQRCSYPKLIATFIGAEPFTQPTLRGWDGPDPPAEIENAVGPGRGNATLWFGNPPNIELILRAAQRELDAQNARRSAAWLSKIPLVGVAVEDVMHGLAPSLAIASDGGEAYSRVLVKTNYEAFRCEEPAAVAGASYYQNLGVWGFTISDITQTVFDPRALDSLPEASMRRTLARFEGAVGRLSHEWSRVFHVHPALLFELVRGVLLLRAGVAQTRLGQERLAYVLGGPGLTAFEAMSRQRPRIVTLLIGANNILAAESGGLFDRQGNPLFTKREDFQAQLEALVGDILDPAKVPSRPDLFLGTLPSPTAGPHLVRGRLGQWTSLFPNGTVLTDDQVLLEEEVVAGYNEVIRDLAQRKADEAKAAGKAPRVWLVDINKMQARLLRATRNDAEVARRAVAHAVRVGLVTKGQATEALEAVREGDLRMITYLRSVDMALLDRRLDQVEDLLADQEGAGIGQLMQQGSVPAAAGNGVDAFVVRLDSGKPYRLTGDYVAADGGGSIMQGGAVSLDTLHLTITGYAYIAREFLQAIYMADAATEGRILDGLPGASRTVADFNEVLLAVARKDPLLNDVPRLSRAVVDLLSAVGAARE